MKIDADDEEDGRGPRRPFLERLEKMRTEGLTADPFFRRTFAWFLVLLGLYLSAVIVIELPFQLRRAEEIKRSVVVYRAYWDGRYHTDAHYELKTRVLPISLYEASEDGLAQCEECNPSAPVALLAPPFYLLHHYLWVSVAMALVYWTLFLNLLFRRNERRRRAAASEPADATARAEIRLTL